MRLLLLLAAALALAVSVSSAMLRLSSAGAGCTPWPQCHVERTDAAAAGAVPAESVPAWHQPVRLTHRITASLAGLAFLLATLFGWRGWSRSERAAALTLLAVSAGLAVLGRYTPSPLPAVVQANLLGGHLLLAALAWLLVRPRLANHSGAQRAPGPAGLAGLLVVLVLAQAALGGLVSARAAAAACQAPAGCSVAAIGTVGAFDAWRPNRALGDSRAVAPARQAVLQVHTLGGLLTLALALLLAWRGRRVVPAGSVAIGGVAVLGAGLGWALRWHAWPLPVAVLHGVAAVALLALATAVWRRLGRVAH